MVNIGVHTAALVKTGCTHASSLWSHQIRARVQVRDSQKVQVTPTNRRLLVQVTAVFAGWRSARAPTRPPANRHHRHSSHPSPTFFPLAAPVTQIPRSGPSNTHPPPILALPNQSDPAFEDIPGKHPSRWQPPQPTPKIEAARTTSSKYPPQGLKLPTIRNSHRSQNRTLETRDTAVANRQIRLCHTERYDC